MVARSDSKAPVLVETYSKISCEGCRGDSPPEKKQKTKNPAKQGVLLFFSSSWNILYLERKSKDRDHGLVSKINCGPVCPLVSVSVEEQWQGTEASSPPYPCGDLRSPYSTQHAISCFEQSSPTITLTESFVNYLFTCLPFLPALEWLVEREYDLFFSLSLSLAVWFRMKVHSIDLLLF